MTKFHYLLIAAVVLSLAAWIASEQEQKRFGLDSGALLVPELEGQLDDIDRVLIRVAGGPRIRLAQTEGEWRVMDRDGYPADTTVLRRELRKIAQARKLEAKTDQADSYARLGVQDVDLAEDTTVQIVASKGVPNPAEPALLNLIVGNSGRSGSYVRQADQTRSWLIDTRISLPRTTAEWLDKNLLKLSRQDIQRIAITPAEGPAYTLSKSDAEQTDFDLSPAPPQDQTSNAANLNRLGAALANLRLTDVAVETPEDLSWSQAEFTSFNGLSLHLEVAREDSARYLRLSASSTADAEEAAAEAQRINTLAKDRVFLMDQYAVDALSMTHAMMLQSPPEAPE